MAFIAMDTTVCYMIKEQSSLEYQEMMAMSEYDEILEQMSSYTQAGGKTTDSQYAYLQAQQQLYDSNKTKIETRLKVIREQVENYKKAVDNNIKNDCKLNITG